MTLSTIAVGVGFVVLMLALLLAILRGGWQRPDEPEAEDPHVTALQRHFYGDPGND